jgi:diguanylate cyclase (GGDEF)-like protein/putative nucleotidyltransferase with HDIG domain/PAS domain S-box-containing protein
MVQSSPNLSSDQQPIDPELAATKDPPADPAPLNASVVEQQFQDLNQLLHHVEPNQAAQDAVDQVDSNPSPTESPLAPRPPAEFDNRLVQARLGLAGSLLTALRCRDACTAAHCIRVALGCSTWSLALEVPESQRDALEVAALLHDIGKIGVSDAVLLKPAALSPEEQVVMDGHRTLGLQILESCCASPEVVSIVRHCAAWFDGSRGRIDCQGIDLPVGARILAIVNAFDSMTNPQVYHSAMSHDRAIQELCQCAGTQFDPDLVFRFAQLHATDHQKLHGLVARRWLQELDASMAQEWWRQQYIQYPVGGLGTNDSLHEQKLLENMYDGVIFLGPQLQVMHWNRGAQRLTGINSAGVIQRRFTPGLIHMRDEHGGRVADDQCPVSHAMYTGVQSHRRFVVRSRSGSNLAVDLHIIPVVGPDGSNQGITLLLRDASDEVSLEQRCHHLYEQAIRDPLTQLANRAEFDRAHAIVVEAHRQRRLPCSLIMCDLDHFKEVNDTYGHLAGDEAIKSFARILKSLSHPGDLVARFGGEEFVILCADSNNATATARAEQIRRAFHELPQAIAGGKTCTASFGVTELQPGDTVQTMLNRADRALLMAKQAGRNLVVQIGSGWSDEPTERRRGWWFWQNNSSGPLLERDMVTNVPVNITAEKLLGFVADQRGQITSVEGNCVQIHIHSGKFGSGRRRSDRSMPLVVDLQFSTENRKPQRYAHYAFEVPEVAQTNIHVIIRAKRARERRHFVTLEQARHVMASLRAYLMANEAAPSRPDRQTQSDNSAGSKTGIMMSAWLSP